MNGDDVVVGTVDETPGTALVTRPYVLPPVIVRAGPPWWVWALGALGMYWLVTTKAGRRRMTW